MYKTFSASLDQLYNMLRYIKEQAVTAGFDPTQVVKIELATEEALVNIIKYGYPNNDGCIDIHCSCPQVNRLKIAIKDHGIPFNPLMHAMTFVPGNFFDKNMRIGGYGIFFIFKIMDEVEYIRDSDSNSNILTLVKYIKK